VKRKSRSQIHSGICQSKNFTNQSSFAEVVIKKEEGVFLNMEYWVQSNVAIPAMKLTGSVTSTYKYFTCKSFSASKSSNMSLAR